MNYQKKFQDEYRKLNLQQKKAVDTIEGPVMVIAGPGTGKTQILAMRIANILNKSQVNPSNILALTFTNSGVYQMKRRLLEMIGPQSYNVHIHTFHSFCNEIIETFPERFIQASELNRLLDLEQVEMLKEIINRHDFLYLKPLKDPFYYVRSIIKSISDLKQEGFTPLDFEQILEGEAAEIEQNSDQTTATFDKRKKDLLKNQELAIIYQNYQELLEKNGRYDYTDMILFVLKAFKEETEILRFYQEKYQYILVDEYQDTNSAQNEIVKILGSFYETPNVFVVGDDEQSIFRFQGASLENILFFSNNFPNTKIIVLKDNYRNSQLILDASRNLILNNQDQIFNRLKISKVLRSQTNKRGNIYLASFSNEQNEYYFIATKISELIKSGEKPEEIAVFYREHQDADELIEYFARLKIPYQIEIGRNVLQNHEILKLVKIITVVDSPQNDLALFEIMHYSFFNLSVTDVYKLANYAGKEKKSLFGYLLEKNYKNLKLKKPKAVQSFIKLILQLQSFDKNNTLVRTFDYIINETGYLKYILKSSDSPEHLNRLQSLYQEIKIVNLKDHSANLKTLINYLKNLADNNLPIIEKKILTNSTGVHLMTAHKAKGLEFKSIFLIKAIDKHWGNVTKRELIRLPKSLIKFSSSGENDEEERRLFYVALTRAKTNIYITYALSYNENNQNLVPSKFIAELPTKHLTLIPTEKSELQFGRRLKLFFAPKPHLTKNDDFVDSLIKDFKLSATSLNAYLNCPYSFFLNQLLRVPKAKDFSQSYGTAIHFALEKFFRKFQKEFALPKKSDLLDFFNEGLQKEALKEVELRRAKVQGGNHLKRYFDFYQQDWQKAGPPLLCEYNFKNHNVHFENIPISGILDKIELISAIGNTINIVDYKTSAPKSLNELMGLTGQKRFQELNQAYFYQLLADNDPLFQWKPLAVVFDFISPQNDRFKLVKFPLEAVAYKTFRQTVRTVYEDILKHRFEKNLKNCKKFKSECEYYDLCQNNL